MLRSLYNFIIHFQKVAFFKSLEAKKIVVEVAGIIEFGINLLDVLFGKFHQLRMNEAGVSSILIFHGIESSQDLQIVIFSLFVQVANFYPRRKFRVVWMYKR